MKSTALIVIGLLLMATATVSAQSTEPAPLRSLFKVEWGLMGNLGLTHERPIGDQWTVNLGGEIRLSPLLINMNPSNTEHNLFFWFNHHPIFFADAELRRYYNRSKKLERGNSLANNAGHYIAFNVGYAQTSSPVFDPDYPLGNAVLSEIHWGIQWPDRQWRRWSANFHVGVGYAYNLVNNSSDAVYPTLDLKLALLLIK